MMTEDFMYDLPKHRSSAIKVIGVGGGGSNAVNHMYQQGIEGVDFVVCNTDIQALSNSPVSIRIPLGKTTTEGLGAGANPEVGEQAALESLDDLRNILDSHTKMVFITAGMGGGTGTGAAPIIAGLAKDMGILTVGIVTVPFYFEGKRRIEQAEAGVERLRKSVDSLIVINNDKLRELYGNLGYKESFAKADEVLTTAAKGIAEVISKHYATNIDLHDARTVLANSGTAIMGAATASGEDKAINAVTSALDSPLLNNNKIKGATNVLLLIVSGDNEVTMDEIGIISDYIQNEAGHNANIIMGVGEDPELGDEISVTVVATGFPDGQDFNGSEPEQVVHVLTDRIEPVRKVELPVAPQPAAESTMAVRTETTVERTENKLESDSNEVRFFLEIEEEVKPEVVQIKEQEPELKLETKETSVGVIEFPEEIEEEKQEVEAKDEFAQTVIFTLDDSLEDIPAAPKATLVEEMPEEKVEDPFDSPISQSLSHKIEERRARLKQFNYKFKNSMTNKSIDEMESIPAYKRQGLELSGKEDNSPSDFIITKDSNDELRIRPNNYLHDQVD